MNLAILTISRYVVESRGEIFERVRKVGASM